MIQPLVSIMIPAYNASEYVEDCLLSIVNQDYENIQVVLVDDCSKDDTYHKALAFQALYQYKKIEVYRNHSNKGVTENCNIALEKCNGKYVCFFAADDLMLPYKISQQVSLLESNPLMSFVYHRVRILDQDSGTTISESESNRTIYNVFDIIRFGGLPGANSVMARFKYLPAGFYNSNIATVSDWMMFIELALRGEIGFIPEILAVYRKHRGGVSQKANNLFPETFQCLNIIAKRFSNSKYIKKINKIAIRRLLVGGVVRAIMSQQRVSLASFNETTVRDNDAILYYLVKVYCMTLHRSSFLNRLVCRAGIAIKNSNG